jgi:hypothetical protein
MSMIHRTKDRGNYADYYLTQSDYYKQNHRLTGRWFGREVRRLELTQEARKQDFCGVKLRRPINADQSDLDSRATS